MKQAWYDETDVDMKSEDESVNDNSLHANTVVSYTEAINAVNTLNKQSGNIEEYTNKHISNLLELRTVVVKKQFTKPPKQASLTDFSSRPKA